MSAESAGYRTGDVAETSNEHAARSTGALGQADDAMQANSDALAEAAANLGTNPDAVHDSFQAAVDSFNATNDAQWASMGIEGPTELGGGGFTPSGTSDLLDDDGPSHLLD